MQAWERDVNVLLDTSRPVHERLRAAESLGPVSNPTVTKVLLRLAASADSPVALQVAVGKAVARIFIATGRVTEAPLQDLTGPAYEGFDEEIARTQRGNPDL